eukprot:COSAG01_NODE_199_length_22202_cov_23.993668_27_plen_111_part_00
MSSSFTTRMHSNITLIHSSCSINLTLGARCYQALDRKTRQPTNLLPLAITAGSTLNVLVVYNKHAGQTSIAGVQKDKFGNAAGTEFDLGVDGAFEGLQVFLPYSCHLYIL